MPTIRQTLLRVPRDPIDRAILAFLCAAGAELDRHAERGRPSTDVIDDAAALVAHLITNSCGAVTGKRERFLQLLDNYLAEAAAHRAAAE